MVCRLPVFPSTDSEQQPDSNFVVSGRFTGRLLVWDNGYPARSFWGVPAYSLFKLLLATELRRN